MVILLSMVCNQLYWKRKGWFLDAALLFSNRQLNQRSDELLSPPSAESPPESLLACNDLDDLLEPFEPRSLHPLDLLSTGL
jgi:hypothetical protein